jgi:hypothetical protein
MKILAYFSGMNDTEIQQLATFFREKDSFSREDLYQYWVRGGEIITPSALGWRIHELKYKNIIQEVKTGWYTLLVKPVYTPTPDTRLRKINKIITEHFPEVQYSIWNMDWLNEFMRHQFNRDACIVEIEKDMRETLGYLLREKGFKDTLWPLPGKGLTFVDAVDPIFLCSLITRAPLQQVPIGKEKFIPCPTLEKILVDIFEDEKIFHFVQGAELEHIFEQALTHYAVNLTTLLGYAKRRGKEPELRAFLRDHFSDVLTTTIE